MTRRKMEMKHPSTRSAESPKQRRKHRERIERALLHIDKGEDYPIAFWNHQWMAYTMDELPGLYRVFNGDLRLIDKSLLIAAFDTFQKKWALFVKLSDDETEEKIQAAIERKNLPF